MTLTAIEQALDFLQNQPATPTTAAERERLLAELAAVSEGNLSCEHCPVDGGGCPCCRWWMPGAA